MVAWGEHRLAEDAPPSAPSTAEARPRSEFSRSLGLNLLTSVTPQPGGSQANGRPASAPLAPALPVFWQARPRVWVTTDHEAAPFEDSEEARRAAAEVWRPVAYAGAAMRVYATEAVRRERRGLAPVAPSHPAAPVTVAPPDGSCYHTYHGVLPEGHAGADQPTYLLTFNLTGVPRAVVRRAQVPRSMSRPPRPILRPHTGRCSVSSACKACDSRRPRQAVPWASTFTQHTDAEAHVSELSCTSPVSAFRAQVTLDGGAATVAAELTLRPRAADGSGAMDLAATPTIWRLFGRCPCRTRGPFGHRTSRG